MFFKRSLIFLKMKHDSHYFVFIPVNLITYRSQSGKKYTEQKKNERNRLSSPERAVSLKDTLINYFLEVNFAKLGCY